MKTLASPSPGILAGESGLSLSSPSRDPLLCRPESPFRLSVGVLHLASAQQRAIHPVFSLSPDPQVDLDVVNDRSQEIHHSKTVHVKFQIQTECSFGDEFLLVGDDPMLGLWDPDNGIPLTWSDDHVWTAEMDMPIGKTIRYKFILKASMGTIFWQPGPDRTFQSWETTNTITVSEEWEDAENQKLIEEDGFQSPNVEPIANSEMSVVDEPIVNSEISVVDEPIVNSEMSVVDEPIVNSEMSVVDEPIVNSEMSVVDEPIVNSEMSVDEPIVNSEMSVDEPIVNSEMSVLDEPIVNSEMSVVDEPIVNSEMSVLDEPIVNSEMSVVDEPIVNSEMSVVDENLMYPKEDPVSKISNGPVVSHDNNSYPAGKLASVTAEELVFTSSFPSLEKPVAIVTDHIGNANVDLVAKELAVNIVNPKKDLIAKEPTNVLGDKRTGPAKVETVAVPDKDKVITKDTLAQSSRVAEVKNTRTDVEKDQTAGEGPVLVPDMTLAPSKVETKEAVQIQQKESIIADVLDGSDDAKSFSAPELDTKQEADGNTCLQETTKTFSNGEENHAKLKQQSLLEKEVELLKEEELHAKLEHQQPRLTKEDEQANSEPIKGFIGSDAPWGLRTLQKLLAHIGLA